METTHPPKRPPFAPAPSDRSQEQGAEQPVKIDLQELAREVYALMKEDLRRERERQGRA